MVEPRPAASEDASKIPFAENIPLGIMLEVPAAALCIDALLEEVDFVSIGSNDLIQYVMAADRDNPKVAHLCEPFSPPVLRLLRHVITRLQRARQAGDAVRRDGGPAALLPAALRHGPAPLQHEPRVRADDQGTGPLLVLRPRRADRLPRLAVADFQGGAEYLTR